MTTQCENLIVASGKVTTRVKVITMKANKQKFERKKINLTNQLFFFFFFLILSEAGIFRIKKNCL